MVTKKELQEQLTKQEAEIAKLREQIEAMPEDKPKGRFKPEVTEVYWFHDTYGNVHNNSWDDDHLDEGRHSMGNCYSTEEEAQLVSDRQKLITELRDFANFEPNWGNGGQKKYSLFFNNSTDEWKIMFYVQNNFLSPVWFESEDRAEAAIGIFGEERLNLLLN